MAQTHLMRPRPSPPSAVDRDRADVVAWRRQRLERAGFSPRPAADLAGDPRTDVHALLDLVDRGCPPDLAGRILAPLDRLDAPCP